MSLVRVSVARAIGLVLAAAFAILTASVSHANQPRKVALVIGNSAYQAVSRLPNPVNDAEAIATTLKKIGFEVTLNLNLDGKMMRAALRDFEDRVDNASIALVYYAGHGIEVDGVNYLIPTDAQLRRDTHVRDEAVALDRVMDAVSGAKTLRLVLLDACRDNPFTAKMTRTIATRSIGRGLAPIEPSASTLISYAAEAGTTAADGTGSHSPYAEALLNHLPSPGLEINFVFRRVNADVRSFTSGQQQPGFYASLGTEEVYLVNPLPAAPAPREQPDASAEYQRALELNTVAGWDAFLQFYGTGYYAELARAARERLVAAVPSARGSQNQEKIDELALDEVYWRTIRDSIEPRDFKAYLRRYPTGAFADLANARIAALERAQEVQALVPGGQNSSASLRREALAQIDKLPKNMLQYGLLALGFPISKVSGVLDAQTRRAIREYQASVGDTQTGELTPQQSIDLLLAAAASGDSHAQNAVGYMAASGMGLSRNYEVAYAWLSKSAKQDNPYAYANLAVLFRDGLGVPKNPEQARQLKQKAGNVAQAPEEPAFKRD